MGQFREQIDRIQELHDPESFHDIIHAYIESHPRRKPQKEDKLPAFATTVIASRCVPTMFLTSVCLSRSHEFPLQWR